MKTTRETRLKYSIFFLMLLAAFVGNANTFTQSFMKAGQSGIPTSMAVHLSDLNLPNGATLDSILLVNVGGSLDSASCGMLYDAVLLVNGVLGRSGCGSDLEGYVINASFDSLFIETDYCDCLNLNGGTLITSDVINLKLDLIVYYTPNNLSSCIQTFSIINYFPSVNQTRLVVNASDLNCYLPGTVDSIAIINPRGSLNHIGCGCTVGFALIVDSNFIPNMNCGSMMNGYAIPVGFSSLVIEEEYPDCASFDPLFYVGIDTIEITIDIIVYYISVPCPNDSLVSFTGLDTMYCADHTGELLVPSIYGGQFVGAGMHNSTFKPKLAGAGTHVITYTYTDTNGCVSNYAQSTSIHSLPSVSFTGLDTLYTYHMLGDSLFGFPSGGTFSGNGMMGSFFSPQNANEGYNMISYSYTDGNGCWNMANKLTVLTIDTLADGGQRPFPITDIKDESQSNDFVVYPNPNPGHFTIELQGRNANSYQMQLLNAAGQVVWSEVVEANSDKHTFRLDNLSGGIYFIQLMNDEKVEFKRVLIQ